MARLKASTANVWVCPYCGHAHPSPWPDRIVWAFMTIEAPLAPEGATAVAPQGLSDAQLIKPKRE